MSSAPSTVWTEVRSSGDAAEFHARPIPDDVAPSVWWFDVERPAIVLGSAQPIEHLDLAACRDAGVEVVRRRSGGGAVLLAPGDVVWVDVVIPTTHHHWTSDVTSSAWWLGEVWRRALADLGVPDGSVHIGPMVTTPWSSRVCFAGVGGGEVVSRSDDSTARTAGKIVGISQRRTRSAARFQCAVHRRWRPAEVAAMFASPVPPLADLDDVVTTVAADPAAIRTALLRHLHAS